MHRLFLDANVLFTAAHNPEGKAALLFHPAGGKWWRLISSAYAVEEARRNIAVKYPRCESRLDDFVTHLAIVSQPPPTDLPIILPEKDRPIFLAACAAKATHLLTGDLKHFGRYMNRPSDSAGITIQTVAEFLRSLGDR